ncbi:Hsp70 family protein [Clathrospora elynae]|uniref:Hsp70 family protein n=1 Tax=Clathrospora elynae TaxID=706981 RepID=A0A6A5SY49_9PLEO|nr:Hsp70 family protein [Clathrospora elynae]
MLANRLVVGIDYGTTYTGVAFCETSGTNALERQIQIVQNWPAAHSMIGTKEKVPSEIAYTENGRTLWGSMIPPNVQRHIWTKLDLDNNRSYSGEAAKIRQELAHSVPRKPAVDIVSEYLSKVKEQLMKNLDAQFGPILWRSLPITLVITMPAIWSDGAKDRTLQAFNAAGFTHMDRDFAQLKRTIATTEPEAAALYTLSSLRGTIREDTLKIDDGFVVCDMGGGTVDLISYRIAGNTPTIVEEVTIGTGDQCGGSFVDREFITWLERRLGKEDFLKVAGYPEAAQCWHTSLSQKLGRMLQEFTLNSKSGFSGSEDNYIPLPAPLTMVEDEARGMCDGCIHIKASDVKQMFESCLRKTCELIADQIQKAKASKRVSMKYVFLVGGFAESPYIYGKIKEYCEGLGLETIKPGCAWSAVARGAVVKGIEGDSTAILTRKSRRHYGTVVCRSFVSGLHEESDAFTHAYFATEWARDQTNWLIHKGQDMHASHETHAAAEIYTQFWPGEERFMSMKLIACDAEDAPTSSKHAAVYNVTTVVADLRNVPDSYLEMKVNPIGETYFHVKTLVHISMQSTLDFYITVNGKKCGSIAAQYE